MHVNRGCLDSHYTGVDPNQDSIGENISVLTRVTNHVKRKKKKEKIEMPQAIL